MQQMEMDSIETPTAVGGIGWSNHPDSAPPQVGTWRQQMKQSIARGCCHPPQHGDERRPDNLTCPRHRGGLCLHAVVVCACLCVCLRVCVCAVVCVCLV